MPLFMLRNRNADRSHVPHVLPKRTVFFIKAFFGILETKIFTVDLPRCRSAWSRTAARSA